MISTVRRRVSKLFQSGHRFYAALPNWKMQTMNDLPQPQPNWKAIHDKNQRFHNAVFVFGIGWLLGTIALGQAAGFLEFHSDIPERPADIDCYKEDKYPEAEPDPKDKKK